MAKDELIYSVWAADETPLAERAVQVLTAIGKTFPKVTVWRAGHQHDRGIQDRFFVDTPFSEDEIVEGFNALELWRQTVEHFARLGLNSDFISVQFSAWSDELNGSVGIYFSDYQFNFDNWDAEVQEERQLERSDVFLQLLKQIGSGSATSGIWMLNHSAFAGDSWCLYEPKQLFANYYNVLKYEQTIKLVRDVRSAVRATFMPDQIAEMLRELGAKVEPLGQDRLFVQFGSLGGHESERILPKLEQRITAGLGKQDYRLAA